VSGCSKLEATNLAAITAANLIMIPEDRTSLAEDEPALLARAKEGDRQALFALYQAHAGRIYSLILSATKDVAAAENLTRDIFVEAFTSLDAVTDDAAFAARLYRCAAEKSLATELKRRYPQGFGHRLAQDRHLNFVGQGDLAINPE
jgi:hypothetical protein